MRVLFDTSVLVPAVVDQLANHAAALDALLGYTNGEHSGYCSTHALAECYATLTALPLRRRILPGEAQQLVEGSLLGRLTAVPLTRDDYVAAIRRVGRGGFDERRRLRRVARLLRGADSRGPHPDFQRVGLRAASAGGHRGRDPVALPPGIVYPDERLASVHARLSAGLERGGGPWRRRTLMIAAAVVVDEARR